MKQNARVILSGGAALGLAHIGVLKVLESHYNITGIIGTSMGAIIGGLYSIGYTPERILEIATKNNAKRLFSPMNLDTTLSGIFEGKMILKLFEDWTDNTRIERCKIPYIAISYDLLKNNTVVIDKGSLAKAMRASSSVPYIFSPYQWERYVFVDGGVEYPLPLGLGKAVTDEITIAVNVLPSKSKDPERIFLQNDDTGKSKMKLHEVFLRCIIQNQAFLALNAIADNEPDLVIDAWYPKGTLFDFDKAETYYHWGITRANEAIVSADEPNYTKKLRNEYRILVSKLSKGLHKIAVNLEENIDVTKFKTI